MAIRLTFRNQVTIPRKVRDALKLVPGSAVEFVPDADGDVVVRNKSDGKTLSKRDRFDRMRGTAQIRWRTDELMTLLRG